jgi:type IV pilus assembly protein PilY1
MDLNQNGAGEQVVTSALIAGGMVTFSTNRPIPPAAGTCSTTLGEARGYWVNLLNGSGAIGVGGTCGGQRSSPFVGGGLPPSPVLANGVPIAGKATTVVIGAVQKGSNGAVGASVPIAPQKIRPAISSKRKRSYSYTSGAE